MRRLLWLALLSGLPGVLGTILLLQIGNYPLKVHLTLLTFVVGLWLIFVTMLRNRVIPRGRCGSCPRSTARGGNSSAG